MSLQQRFREAVRVALADYLRSRGLDAAAASTEIEFDSASLDVAGLPRFKMTLPAELINDDLGAAHVFYHDVMGRGFEFGLRRFLDLHLASDDVFVDVGAHWGIHALTAATVHPHQISVLAVEAHPDNCARLRRWVELNRLEGDIDVVCGAIGDRQGVARLWMSGSSMGHSVRGEGHEPGSTAIDIDMTTIDRLVAERSHLRWRRFFLKIDVEGNEGEALEGARGLFEREDVAAVVWEKSAFRERAAQAQRDEAVWRFLDSRGFQHYRMEDENLGGRLLPLESRDVICNIFSLAPSLRPRASYG